MATDSGAEAFAEELAALKRRGCSLLVVSPTGDGSLCEELLGDPAEPRRRVVVETGLNRHIAPTATDRVRIDASREGTRSSVASRSTTDAATDGPETPSSPGMDAGGRDPSDDTVASPDDLDGIETAIGDAIESFGGFEDLEPGELRVCLGDLAPLTIDTSDDDLVSFLGAVTDMIRAASGMVHVHVSPDTEIRGTVEDLFDITVEVRITGDGRQYRWHLHGAGLDSGWLALD